MSIIDQLLGCVFFWKICSKLYFYRVNLETSCSGTAEKSQSTFFLLLSLKDRRIYFLTTYVSEAADMYVQVTDSTSRHLLSSLID